MGVVGAHEHGVARLALAVEGPEIFVTLEAPGDVIFGFEREPETDEEWTVVAERIGRLEAGLAAVFEVDDGLECRAAGPVQVTGAPRKSEPSGAVQDHDDGHDHEAGHDESEGHEHSEVRAEVTLVCDAVPSSRDATLKMAALLPGLEQVDLTILTATGQAAARVSGDAPFSF